MPKDTPSSKTAKRRSKSRGHSEVTETKADQTTPIELNIVAGHDYTNAQFEEVDLSFRDQVVPTLQKVDVLELFTLTAPTGPGKKYSGLGWRDLLAVTTVWDEFDWLSMGDIAWLTERTKTNDNRKFRVWFCPPGLLHIEVDDSGAWSVQDIVALPGWMFLG